MRRFCAFVLLASMPSLASAGLTLCNETSHATSVAFGYFWKDETHGSGWTDLAEQSCVEVSEPEGFEGMPSRYGRYGVAWRGAADVAWTGCTMPHRFVLIAGSTCPEGAAPAQAVLVAPNALTDWTSILQDETVWSAERVLE
jgi:uncharacterized membrane protein